MAKFLDLKTLETLRWVEFVC